MVFSDAMLANVLRRGVVVDSLCEKSRSMLTPQDQPGCIVLDDHDALFYPVFEQVQVMYLLHCSYT